VASMLRLQANAVRDPVVTSYLEDAANRALAVTKVHQRVQLTNGAGRLDLSSYVRGVCRGLNEAVPLRSIEVATEPGIDVATDRAILIVLIVNELVTKRQSTHIKMITVEPSRFGLRVMQMA
jgi:two-component sensor histidine kinase